MKRKVIGAIRFVMERKRCKEKILTVSKVSDMSSSKSGINLLHAGRPCLFLHPLFLRSELSVAGGGAIVLDVRGERLQLFCAAADVVFHVKRGSVR